MVRATRSSLPYPTIPIHQQQIPCVGGRVQGAIFEYFAGGGGASHGIQRAVGRPPDLAVNHDEHAIAQHTINNPATKHLLESVWAVDPTDHFADNHLWLAWFSPDCRHFSKAKGKKPVLKTIRGLAWVALRVAGRRRPDIIMLENVEEFETWGRVRRGHPVKKHAGETFLQFIAQLRAPKLGYVVEWRVLDAADYGAPTHRERLVLIARRDGQPIAWPEPTHGPGRRHPYRTAAECLDFSLPAQSIFLTKRAGRKMRVRRPLARASQRRIFDGLRRYVIENPTPFLVSSTTANESYSPAGHRQLAASWIVKYYTSVVGHLPSQPLGTITAIDHHAVVNCPLRPLDAQAENGEHTSAVAAFVVKYYKSGGQHQRVDAPLHTIVSKARFGLVIVHLAGKPYVITDICLRMITPRELARCQGFDDDYRLIGTKAQQIARIGNSVPPPLAEAVVRANLPTMQVPQPVRAARAA